LLFRLTQSRFKFQAHETIRFPTPASNYLRGAFGRTLHGTSGYRRIFAPAGARGPSGLADRPRPFVFRAAHLDGATVERDAPFHFDLNIFDLRPDALAEIEAAFGKLERAELSSVSSQPVAIDLDAGFDPVKRIIVRFVTPTELKSGAKVVDLPTFEILAARIRDRISTLRALYDAGPLAIDFRAFAERASHVELARIETRWVESERRSGRTGAKHPLGGFVGEAEYEGDLREFMPYLETARWTGVGRQTVWGKGEIAVEAPLH
jgi:hypothetical protein